jgi:hypothetical protein
MSDNGPFDYEARALDISAAQERVRTAGRRSTSKLRRLRGQIPSKKLTGTLVDLREALANAYPPGFWEDVARLRNHDPSGAESAIRFLEADPWFTHAGFTKTRLLRHLGKVQLTPAQQERLRTVMLNVVRGRSRMEFTDYCRFARKIYSPELQANLEELSRVVDPVARSQAQKMLYFCEHGRWLVGDTPKGQFDQEVGQRTV